MAQSMMFSSLLLAFANLSLYVFQILSSGNEYPFFYGLVLERVENLVSSSM